MAEPAVDQQRPHVAEGDLLADQILDVDAAVAQRAAVLVGLGDLGGEGDNAFQSRDEILGYRDVAVMGQFLHPLGCLLPVGNRSANSEA